MATTHCVAVPIRRRTPACRVRLACQTPQAGNGKQTAAGWPITAADVRNDRVLPFFEQQQVRLLRILTDRGTEFRGRPDEHPYQLFLAVNDDDHTKAKVKSPQTNGICERSHKTVLQEFYQVAFRKRLYASLEQLQADLDAWLVTYNEQVTHQRQDVLRANALGDLRALDAGWPRRR